MTIQQLARLAGVTTRTIRYYVEQGLLPPPEKGRPAEYTHEHARRLELIKKLKTQYLPLEEIRDTLQRLSPDDVQELLARSEPEHRAQVKSSAADYIASVMARTAEREQMKRQAPPLPSWVAAPPQAYSAPPMPAPSIAAPATVALRAEAKQPEDTTTWQRVGIAPGIELHFRVAGDGATNELARRIMAAAAKVLDEYPGNEE